MYHFFTKMDKEKTSEWYDRVAKSSFNNDPYFIFMAYKLTREDLDYFCIPIPQFKNYSDEEIQRVFTRVRLDNPELCIMPQSLIPIIKDENNDPLYCYTLCLTEKTLKDSDIYLK